MVLSHSVLCLNLRCAAHGSSAITNDHRALGCDKPSITADLDLCTVIVKYYDYGINIIHANVQWSVILIISYNLLYMPASGGLTCPSDPPSILDKVFPHLIALMSSIHLNVFAEAHFRCGWLWKARCRSTTHPICGIRGYHPSQVVNWGVLLTTWVGYFVFTTVCNKGRKLFHDRRESSASSWQIGFENSCDMWVLLHLL